MPSSDLTDDIWSAWLLRSRNGGDPDFERVVATGVRSYVDRVLDCAQLDTNMTLLDVGAGDGAVAFRAIERVGTTLRVILADVSPALLQRAELKANELGVRSQCTFVLCSAHALSEVEDGSVDVVATRSALAYVQDKVSALREFHRVLKPGGRIALGEPIFQDDAVEACTLKTLTQSGAKSSRDQLTPLLHRWRAAQFPDTPQQLVENPLTNFSERTLFTLVQALGFFPIQLELRLELQPAEITSWKVFLDTAPHPLAPTLRAILESQFSATERAILEDVYRPMVESGQAKTVSRMAYLTATKTVATA